MLNETRTVIRKLRYQALLFGLLGAVHALVAQRYANEVFDAGQLTITPDVPYARNIDFLHSDFSDPELAASEVIQLQYFVANHIPIPLTFFDPESPSTLVKLAELRMDVYQPDQTLDCEQARPLFIYLHTGDLMPPPLNGRPVGTRKDSSAVEICRRMAQRGYVAASLSYRLGWSPQAADPDTLRGTWINALYRAMHDLEEGIRVLKLAAVQYHADPDRVIVCGEGIGGSIALAAATLDDPAELFIPKLLPDASEPDTSYVDQGREGNLDGFNGFYNLYHPSLYDSHFDVCVSMGGTLVDTSWLAPGDPGMVAFHGVFDPVAPFSAGNLLAFPGGAGIIPVHGPDVYQPLANTLGNNAAFTGLPDGDPYTDRARDLYGTSQVHTASTVAVDAAAEGTFPFVTPDWPAMDPATREEGAPWIWWDALSPVSLTEVAPGVTAHEAELAGDPDMAPAKGRAYIDTIMGYMNPRIISVLGLPGDQFTVGMPCDDGHPQTFNDVYDSTCTCAGIPIGIEEAGMIDGLTVWPVPVDDVLRVSSTQRPIVGYDLYDAVGRLARSASVNAFQFMMSREGLQAGTYILMVRFANSRVTRKVVLD